MGDELRASFSESGAFCWRELGFVQGCGVVVGAERLKVEMSCFFGKPGHSKNRRRNISRRVLEARESSAFGLLRGYEMLWGCFEGLLAAKSG